MNKKYMIYPIEDSGEFFYCVYETGTCQVLDFFYFEEDAEQLKKKLESGIGFDGHTPMFMLNKTGANREINSRFKEYHSRSA